MNQTNNRRNRKDDDPIIDFPKTATGPGRRFFDTLSQSVEVMIYFIRLAINSDYVWYIANQALEGRLRPEELDPYLLAETNPGENTKYLRSISQTFFEMIVCRVVENFENYLSEITRDVLKVKPQIMRSQQDQVKLEYILQFTTMEELVEDLIERKVNDVGYSGFRELEKWFSDRMGIALLDNVASRDFLIEFIETRNIIVHNRAIVNQKYLSKVPHSPLKLGELRRMESDYFEMLFTTLNYCVLSLDKRVAKKFSLKTKRYKQLVDDNPSARRRRHQKVGKEE